MNRRAFLRSTVGAAVAVSAPVAALDSIRVVEVGTNTQIGLAWVDWKTGNTYYDKLGRHFWVNSRNRNSCPYSPPEGV